MLTSLATEYHKMKYNGKWFLDKHTVSVFNSHTSESAKGFGHFLPVCRRVLFILASVSNKNIIQQQHQMIQRQRTPAKWKQSLTSKHCIEYTYNNL